MSGDKESENLRVVAMYPLIGSTWENSHLTKDCGLVPFLLHKLFGMEADMVGCTDRLEDYPSLALMDGLNLVSLPGDGIEEKVDYLVENGKSIDLLVLHGIYATNQAMAIMYKLANPNGKVLVQTDLNFGWLERTDETESMFQQFLTASDVMAASCTEMAHQAAKKWNRDVICLTNGYYSWEREPDNEKILHDKEDVILTVGRLGTSQKATEVLLEAFRIISDEIPGWTLRLVGSVDEGFKPYINEYYEKNPLLRDRVVFTGVITDKKKLSAEYGKAKVFTLSSRYEGGPNVIAESLHAGCVPVITRIDAWRDCTADSSLGAVAEIDDIEGYALELKKTCLNPDLMMQSQLAREYADKFFNMEKNIRYLHDLLFG